MSMRSSAVLLLLLSAACEAPAPERAPAVDTDSAVAERGSEAARRLREGLVGLLTAAMESGGPVAGIEICASAAMVLTDSIARELGEGITVRRTSRRVRNPANAPDSLDLAALAWFEAELAAAGALPEHYVQAVTGGGYRYYEPLRTMPLCVQCHGPAEALDPAVRAAIAERYPEDRAVGYAEGDLRGLIRVGIPATQMPR